MTTAQELTDFVLEHDDLNKQPRKELLSYFQAKIKHGQLYIVRDKAQIIALIEWRLVKKDTAEIENVVIHKQYRNKRLPNLLRKEGRLVYPFVKYIEFTRRNHTLRRKL